MEVDETVTLTATASKDNTPVVWKIRTEDEDALTVKENGNPFSFQVNKTGIFTIYVSPKGVDDSLGLAYCASCDIAVTMKDSDKSKIVGAWKITSTSTDSTTSESGWWFKQDGTFYHLSKNDDGKFHYKSSESRQWIQTALENNVYSFTVYQKSSTTSSKNSFKLRFNEDGTFQSMGTNENKFEKIAESDLILDSN